MCIYNVHTWISWSTGHVQGEYGIYDLVDTVGDFKALHHGGQTYTVREYRNAGD